MQVVLLFLISCFVTYLSDCLKTSTYVRGLDKIICDFLGSITPDNYDKLCRYIENYNNYSQEFVKKLAAKDPDFRRIAIVHCDWGKPEFCKYHDRIWYDVWMQWNETRLDYLDALVNNTNFLWREYNALCQDANYTRYLDRFRGYSNSSEIDLNY